MPAPVTYLALAARVQVAMYLAVGVLGGALVGVYSTGHPLGWRILFAAAVLGVVGAHFRNWRTAVLVLATIAFLCGGALLAGRARDAALNSSLRVALDDEFGGFRLETKVIEFVEGKCAGLAR